MNRMPIRRLGRGSMCVAFVALLLGCHASQVVTIQTKDGKTVSREDFKVKDSSIVLPHTWIDVKSPDGVYQIYHDSTDLPISQIKEVALRVPETTSSGRALGAFAGGIAGVALGAWAGSSDGFGPTGGIMSGGSQPFVSVAAGAVGACVGICLGMYVGDRLSASTMHFDPGVAADMDSLRVHARHEE